MIKNAIINTSGDKISLPKRGGGNGGGPFHHPRSKSHMQNYGKLPNIAVGSGSFGPYNTSVAESSYGNNPLNNI